MNLINQLKALAVAATLLIAQPIQADTFYFHNDHLGTPQVLTDSAGTTVWQGNYSPFGEATETTDTVEQNIRFPGQYFEEETGLHYNYFRDYDPQTGRYIESDPIGLQGGINTFGYVSGRPISLIDPTGENGAVGGGSAAVTFCILHPGACATTAYAVCNATGLCSVPGDGDDQWEGSGEFWDWLDGKPTTGSCEAGNGDDGDGDSCDEWLEIWLTTCRGLSAAEKAGKIPAGSAFRCYESAHKRHWACENKKPMPPFHGWPQY